MVSCVLFAPDTKCEVLVGLSWCLVACLLQIQSVRYWLVSHGVLCIVFQIQSAWYWLVSHVVLCLVCSRYKVHGIGWSLMVSCVLFAPDTKCDGIGWSIMVSCVLFAPDTKCMVLVALSLCLVSCLLQIQSVRCCAGNECLVLSTTDYQFHKLIENLDHAFLHG